MHWGGVLFAVIVVVLAIPFVFSHFRSPDSPLRAGGARALLAAVVIAALLLGWSTSFGHWASSRTTPPTGR